MERERKKSSAFRGKKYLAARLPTCSPWLLQAAADLFQGRGKEYYRREYDAIRMTRVLAQCEGRNKLRWMSNT